MRLLLELCAGLIGVLAVLAFILIWRLNADPVSSNFLTPYIEAAISSIVPQTTTDIGSTLLTWNTDEHSIDLHADNIIVKDKAEQTIAEIPRTDVRISILGMILGRFLPTRLVVDHPRLKLARGRDGKLYFGGMVTGSEGPGTNAGNGDGQRDTLTGLRGAVHELTHAYLMSKLEMDDAVFDVDDASGTPLWSVRFPSVSIERSLTGLIGNIAINLTQKGGPSTVDVHYVYDRLQKQHHLNARFDNITPAELVGGHPGLLGLDEASIFELPLTGSASATFDSHLSLTAATAEIDGAPGRLIYPDFWEKPRPIQSLSLIANYDETQKFFNITTASFDFGGPKFNVTMKGQLQSGDGHDMDFSTDLDLKNAPVDGYNDLWPKPILPYVRGWIIENISKGTLDKSDAHFKGHLDWNKLGDTDVTEGSGHIFASHADLIYMNSMPPITNVGADATFDLKQMDIKIVGGNIGNLTAQPFMMKITGLDEKDQYINIPMKVVGPVQDVMKLIDHPPLGYAKALGIVPEEMSGQQQGEVDLYFPLDRTLKLSQIELNAKSTITDFASSKLIKGIDIAHGMIDLSVAKDGFSLQGPATINGLPLQVQWHQFYEPQGEKPQVEGKLTGILKEEQWKLLGIDLMENTHGPTNLTMNVTQVTHGKTLLDGDLDMSAADMRIDQLKWKKPANTPASLQLSAEVDAGQTINVKQIAIHAGALSAKGHAVLGADASLKSINFDNLSVGRTNSSLSYAQSDGSDHALRFEAQGQSFDMSGFKGGNEPDHADLRPKEYHVRVAKLYTSDTGNITNAEGYAVRDKIGWSEISLHGLTEDDHKLDIDLTADGASRRFSFTCEDFGKALKSLGLTDSVRDGDVKIVGSSTADNPRAIEGTIKIGHFTVRNLPALAILLNATSPFGFSGILTDSISFDRMNGKFLWQGDTLDLRQVKASGTSIGMNTEGRIDLNTGNAKLRGTLVPFSMVNNALNYIPILGTIITGGDGQGVLAVAYTIGGTLTAPDVSVNPVSLLTPGFLRTLFFGGDDDPLPEMPKEDAPTKTKPVATPPAAPPMDMPPPPAGPKGPLIDTNP